MYLFVHGVKLILQKWGKLANNVRYGCVWCWGPEERHWMGSIMVNWNVNFTTFSDYPKYLDCFEMWAANNGIFFVHKSRSMGMFGEIDRYCESHVNTYSSSFTYWMWNMRASEDGTYNQWFVLASLPRAPVTFPLILPRFIPMLLRVARRHGGADLFQILLVCVISWPLVQGEVSISQPATEVRTGSPAAPVLPWEDPAVLRMLILRATKSCSQSPRIPGGHSSSDHVVLPGSRQRSGKFPRKGRLPLRLCGGQKSQSCFCWSKHPNHQNVFY